MSTAKRENSDQEILQAAKMARLCVPATRTGSEEEEAALLDDEAALFNGKILDPAKKVVVGMVGLPARGKSFLARKLAYYLNWMDIKTQIFNHGEYRRKRLGQRQPAEFYNPSFQEGVQLRLRLAREALRDLLQYLADGGRIGILDATNSSRRRRTMVEKECKRHGVSVLWVESICDVPSVVNDTILKVKANMPEYSGLTPDDVLRDFQKRIDFYRMAYCSLDADGAEKEYSFLQLRDLGEDIRLHKVKNTMSVRISRYLMNVHTRPRSIYISRHGESMFNKAKRIGGDSGLSPAGIKYSVALKAFMQQENCGNIQVWTSSLQRTIQTAALFESVESFKALDELNAGECEGLTYEQIGVDHPKVTECRRLNKYYYRYPRGESYKDVVERLEPLLVALEREENVLIVSHQAVCRCLLAFFKTVPHDRLPKELPYLEVPLHTVLKVTPLDKGCRIETHHLGPDAVNTHQPQSRPSSADIP